MLTKATKFFFIITYCAAIIAVLFFTIRSEVSQKSSNKKGPEQQTQQKKASLPSQIINLSCWKITLPIEELDGSRLPMTIEQPDLSNFSLSPWFEVNKEENGVIFRAPVNAPTTKNSDYPRSELRETECGKKENTFWSSTKGIHTMYLDQAITAIPKKKADVVVGQIHGDDDDIVVIRLEDKKLFVARSKSNLCTLDENYSLGKRFNIKFVVKDGIINIYYNNNQQPSCFLEKNVSKAYFKAGIYTQSNCETEGNSTLCNSENYGEVIIYEISVTHQ